MTTGLGLSAVAAVALGASTFALAIAARRVGTVVATGATLVIALLPLVCLAVVLGASPVFAPRPMLVVALAGTLVAISYLAAIESFRLGPVAVTAPIASATGAATVAASFAILGERPSAGQWVGVAVVATGAVTASLTRRDSGLRLVGLGPVFALVGLMFGAIANAVIRDPIREVGPIEAIVAQRSFTIAALAVVLLALGSRVSAVLRDSAPPRASTLDRRLVLLLLSLGALDAAAFLGFAYAIESAPAWLVGLVTQSGRALALVGGVLLLRERLQRLQWAGIGTLAAGLGVLSLFSA